MSILIEIFNILIAAVLVAGMAFIAYMSSVMVSEKKERQRRGLTDYYDNPIPQSQRTQANKEECKEQTKTANAKGDVFDKAKVKYFDGDNT